MKPGFEVIDAFDAGDVIAAGDILISPLARHRASRAERRHAICSRRYRLL